MKKKVLATLLVAAMTAAMMTGCGSDNNTANNTPAADSKESTQSETPSSEAQSSDEAFDYGSGNITIWAADTVTGLTQELADKFMADNGFNYTVTVESVGEGDAASNMITDVEGGADIFGDRKSTRLNSSH